jgi:hypothetical protein
VCATLALAAALESSVPKEPLALDTSAEIEAIQIEHWRRMTPAQKAELVTGLTRAVFELATAGVRQRYPDASPRELFLRVAIVIHGAELARRAYPEIARLDADDASC